MANIQAVIGEQIRKVSRRVANSANMKLRKLVARHRSEIAALKRTNLELAKRLARLEREKPERAAPPPELLENVRFRADGLRSHRAKLGLSAKDYGKLMGVSQLTVYHWEGGKAKPRKSQLAKIVEVRGLGKREAMERLGYSKSSGEEKPAKAKGTRRSKFSETAEELILRLLKGGGARGRADINAAWTKEGRASTADVTLGLMVKAGKLKRSKQDGVRGSVYSRT